MAHTTYAVNLWGSHPDEGNDDCDTGTEYDTLEEAMAAFNDVENVLLKDFRRRQFYQNWSYVEIDGPGINQVRRNPRRDEQRARREREEDDREWQRERAMQAGMAFGCDGYNDEMGW